MFVLLCPISTVSTNTDADSQSASVFVLAVCVSVCTFVPVTPALLHEEGTMWRNLRGLATAALWAAGGSRRLDCALDTAAGSPMPRGTQ